MSESATPDSATTPRSRRAVLAAAVGGAAAMAAALARPAKVEAAAGSALIIGSEANNAGTANTQLIANSDVVTFKLYQQGPGTALMGYTTPTSGLTRGVYGRVDSPNGDGVQGRNAGAAGTGAGVRAYGGNNTGVYATSDSGNGVWGRSTSAAGVLGSSTSSTGVYGDSGSGTGVYGASASGIGVYGASDSNYAGWFFGPTRIQQYVEMVETSEPATPLANTARIFVRDNASVTELCVKIGSTVYVLAP